MHTSRVTAQWWMISERMDGGLALHVNDIDLHTVQVEIAAAAANDDDDWKEDVERVITSNCRVCSRYLMQRN